MQREQNGTVERRSNMYLVMLSIHVLQTPISVTSRGYDEHASPILHVELHRAHSLFLWFPIPLSTRDRARAASQQALGKSAARRLASPQVSGHEQCRCLMCRASQPQHKRAHSHYINTRPQTTGFDALFQPIAPCYSKKSRRLCRRA